MKPMICFIGLDGSGKSTSVEHAYNILKKKGIDVEVVRAAYVIKYMNLIIKLGKKILLRKDSNPYVGDYREYLDKMRRQAKNGWVYKTFSILTTIEFSMQIFFNIRVKQLMGKTLLVDRYIYDNAVTYAANLGEGEEYIKKTVLSKWKWAPKPDVIIYIKTPVDICCSRKDDIPDPLYLEIREPLYDALINMFNVQVISGCQDKNSMLDEVGRVINSVIENRRSCYD